MCRTGSYDKMKSIYEGILVDIRKVDGGRKVDIEKQFNLIAEEYDESRRKFIPCFDDFYRAATDFIISGIEEPKRVIDLGAGTGLLSYFWYQRCPHAGYVLVDIADEMLNVARKRFQGIENITCLTENYMDGLPEGDFDAVISALSVHHLEDRDKMNLFSKIYGRLPEGGLFVNYDQFCAEQAEMKRWFDGYWESYLLNGDLTKKDIDMWKERRKLDRECSVGQETDMLKKCGFQVVQCVYSCQKFSVIVAIK